MKRIIVAGALALPVLSGCGETETESTTKDTSNFVEQDVKLQDGRTIHCLFWDTNPGTRHSSSGMSCDWGNSKPINPD